MFAIASRSSRMLVKLYDTHWEPFVDKRQVGDCLRFLSGRWSWRRSTAWWETCGHSCGWWKLQGCGSSSTTMTTEEAWSSYVTSTPLRWRSCCYHSTLSWPSTWYWSRTTRITWPSVPYRWCSSLKESQNTHILPFAPNGFTEPWHSGIRSVSHYFPNLYINDT